MKEKWVTPKILVEEFAANEYVAACWGVGCNWEAANEWEKTHYYKKGQTWYDIECSHAQDHCGNSGNQVIYDDNNDGTADRMVEIGTDGLGTLSCKLWTDDTYTEQKNIADVKIGNTIYWTTSAGEKIWHHIGTVFETVFGHPNRS